MRFKRKKNVLRVELTGDLDLKVSPQLWQQLNTYIDREGIHHVFFDFRDVQFIDSSGLGVLLSCYKRLAPYGGTVRAENLTQRVEMVFALAGMDKILKISGVDRGA